MSRDYDPAAPPTALRYLGDGSRFIYGIPQRDVTADDLSVIPALTVVNALATGLYEIPSKRDSDVINKAAEDAATEPETPADPAGDSPAGDAGGVA